MGIETIVALGITAAAAGAATHSSREQAREGKHEAREQAYNQGELAKKAEEQRKNTEVSQAQAAAKARDRSIAATSSVSRPDVATSMLGDLGTPNTKKSSLLGL